MKFLLSTISITLITITGFGQSYTDYLGAGHSEGVTITSSDESFGTKAENTFSGKGLDAKYFDAARFLSQATLGPTDALVKSLLPDNDFEAWIDDQMSMGYDSMGILLDSIQQAVYDMRLAGGQNPNNIPSINTRTFNYTWTQENITTPYLLRHRVAYALSQHFVISFNSNLNNTRKIRGVANFYDMLLEHSFGNYRDLLEDVTFHPTMGFYLTHLNNSRSFPEDNIFPDENYAREIMQLFTIGLFMLNNDGSLQLDDQGNPIPTYDNDDINNLAKVFTGLGAGAVAPHVTFTDTPFFGLNFNSVSVTDPLVMYEFFHEPGELILPDGSIIPESSGPLEDIEAAHDWFFNHQNTPPFFARRMIQRLVKSNPTPEYIERISNVFIDNGNGVRGDLGAVIKAILLDEEARSEEGQFLPSAGRYREPVTKIIAITRAIGADKIFDRYWDNAFRWGTRLKQAPMWSPTVFNFYLPDFQPVGEIKEAGYVAPEFQLHYTSSAIDYINEAYRWGYQGNLLNSSENTYGDEVVTIDYEELLSMVNSPDLVINYLDNRLTYGSMSDQTRGIIRNALNDANPNSTFQKVRMAIYLTLISAEFNIIH